ncbi:transmembrane protein, putative (macronuclear) [Tetrahymena thermophila SB210]|uniref:Transmembrane protein, putative n=1 Tax=Tetrahymena thermophila (strain SB210) TaxID=312017 RepID=Q23VY0_TETTS|nr:transmembrane protein, putative [Tetrahymena thermophila SB210]EAS00725.2 transmembrane protein, putative [Tetrahymena thermophila SB210]|eukprot:XP_001020970.2 transmembrane protein, putative [Tetrahymena thermophila SB210]
MKNLKLLIALLLISALVIAEEVTTEQPNSETKQTADESVEQVDAEPQTQQESQEEFKKRINDLYIACIIATRYQLNTKDADLEIILQDVQEYDEKLNVYRKIFAQHVYQCGLSATKVPSIPDEIHKQLNEKTFKIEDWDLLFIDIKFDKYKEGNFNSTLNAQEQMIMDFVDKVDGSLKKDNNKPKIGSFSLNNLPASVQLLYVVVIIAIFSGLIYFGYKFSKQETTIKVKKQKKEKKSQ